MGFKDLLGFPMIHGSIAIGVKNMDRAIAWYGSKFGFSSEKTSADEVYVGYSLDFGVRRTILMVPILEGRREGPEGKHPVLFSRRLLEVHATLVSEGVPVSPIQKDSGGNHFFSFRIPRETQLRCAWNRGLNWNDKVAAAVAYHAQPHLNVVPATLL